MDDFQSEAETFSDDTSLLIDVQEELSQFYTASSEGSTFFEEILKNVSELSAEPTLSSDTNEGVPLRGLWDPSVDPILPFDTYEAVTTKSAKPTLPPDTYEGVLTNSSAEPTLPTDIYQSVLIDSSSESTHSADTYQGDLIGFLSDFTAQPTMSIVTSESLSCLSSVEPTVTIVKSQSNVVGSITKSTASTVSKIKNPSYVASAVATATIPYNVQTAAIPTSLASTAPTATVPNFKEYIVPTVKVRKYRTFTIPARSVLKSKISTESVAPSTTNMKPTVAIAHETVRSTLEPPSKKARTITIPGNIVRSVRKSTPHVCRITAPVTAVTSATKSMITTAPKVTVLRVLTPSSDSNISSRGY